MNSPDSVVLVDQNGNPRLNPDGSIHVIEKMKAHKEGLLHLAVSVFVFNNKGQLLLQKRAPEKYHSPGLWTNACCTHPYLDERPEETAHRRLREEMGLDCALTEAFTFMYKEDVGGGLVENEFDHVFVGYCDRDPKPDPAEVSEWKWISLEELESDLKTHLKDYTVWFRLCFPQIFRF
jgi:isopentenyl-diphosphate delta-isomerase